MMGMVGLEGNLVRRHFRGVGVMGMVGLEVILVERYLRG